MSEYHGHYRSQFSCIDHSLKPVVGSSHDHNGFLFYTVEGVCGSLPCPPYSQDKELSVLCVQSKLLLKVTTKHVL